MNEPAKVFEDRETPGDWRVEWFDDDGRCELEIFVGPTARRDALRYAAKRYGHFEEVQLEPYPPRSKDVPGVRFGLASVEPRGHIHVNAPAKKELENIDGR